MRTLLVLLLVISCSHPEPIVTEPISEPVGAGELRAINPEWDLMTRMFTALDHANHGRVLEIDRIVDQTIADAETHGPHYFLLSYSRDKAWIDPAERSLFVDGEIAMMLAVRQLVKPDPERATLARTWVDRALGQIERSPTLIGESYPDEAWVFCNSVALAATRILDTAEGDRDRHAALFRRWVDHAKTTLVDPTTGMLVSKLSYGGDQLEGPEGSSIWFASAMLRFVDDAFAHDQYARAKAELRGGIAGLAWAREWPASWPGNDDIDSGPVVPGIDASAGSSGLAIVAAAAFGDDEFLGELRASLEMISASGSTGNRLGDAVIAYGLSSGPVFERVRIED